MTECVAQIALNFYEEKPVEVSFDAPQISSDGGAVCSGKSMTSWA